MDDSTRIIRMVGIGLVVVALMVGVWFAVFGRRKGAPSKKRITEVTLTRGDTSVTLNRKGTLTVRTKEGIFQQQWDDKRTANFFDQFESTDLTKFERYGPDSGFYALTIVTEDGKEVTIYIPIGDIEIPEVIEELIETLEELTGGEVTPTPTPLFELPTPTPTSISVPTPTEGPTGIPIPTPTPTPQDDGSSSTPDYAVPFICEFLDPEIRPDILSETLCTP